MLFSIEILEPRELYVLSVYFCSYFPEARDFVWPSVQRLQTNSLYYTWLPLGYITSECKSLNKVLWRINHNGQKTKTSQENNGKTQTAFKVTSTFFYSYQQCMRTQTSPYLWWHLFKNLNIFGYSHPSWYDGFYLHFPSDLMMLKNFSCAYWPFVSTLWRNTYSESLLVFSVGLSFLLLGCRN